MYIYTKYPVIQLVYFLLYTVSHGWTVKSDKHERELALINMNRRLVESLKYDKGKGCPILKMDPFDKEVTKFDKLMPKIVCTGNNWVKCHLSECRVKKSIFEMYNDVVCVYKDLIYDDDFKSHFGKKTSLMGDQDYTLVESDHAHASCYGKLKKTQSLQQQQQHWSGFVAGFRKYVPRKKLTPGRENTFDILILCFDSMSKNGFIRRMPKSYKTLVEDINAVILNGYNIVGDGTTAAFFPILTGKTELELPDVRKIAKNQYMDQLPFIFYKLKEDGYRTAYFEDSPWAGTFQYRFNGWRKQPTDHSLRHFFLKELNNGSIYRHNLGKPIAYCTGDTPTYTLMMKITRDLFRLEGKKFCLTVIHDITHDDFNMVTSADGKLAAFMKNFKNDGILNNTLLILMGDHGPRYITYDTGLRNTFSGKLEERRPLMAIRLPNALQRRRPNALKALKNNMEVLTTPHDVHATILDVIDMRNEWNLYKIRGADLTRGLTLLQPIPNNRSCSEAGIEPHWCTCMKWVAIPKNDTMFNNTVKALVKYVNEITEYKRTLCLPRYLISIKNVMKEQASTPLLKFRNSYHDKLSLNFGPETKRYREEYSVKVVLGPGLGVYEASLSYLLKENKFIIHTRDIQRINAYGIEPHCVMAEDPHLAFFCYCKKLL